MRRILVAAALVVAIGLVAWLALRRQAPSMVEGATPSAATTTARSRDGAVQLASVDGTSHVVHGTPGEATAPAARSEVAADSASEATGSIRGTVRRRIHTYHPEVVERVRATFEVGVVPTPDQLEQAWNPRDLPLEVQTVEPLAGVEVRIAPLHPSAAQRSELRAVSDDLGAFHVDALPAGRYTLRVTPPPGLPRLRSDDPVLSQSVYLDPGERADVFFDLPGERAAFTGRVVDTSGRPIAGATVTASQFVVPEVGVPWEVRARTDAEGRYTLSGLEPASLQTAIQHALRAAQPGSPANGVHAGALLALDVEAAGHVSVRMLAMPLTGEREQCACSLVERLRAWKQAVGEVEWLTLDLELPGAGGSRPVFEAGAQVLPDLVLVGESTVAGRVVDTNDRALPLAELRMVSADGPSVRPGLLTQVPVAPEWTRADERGAFRITGLPSGGYRFEVRTEAAGVQQATNPPLGVPEDADLRDVQVVVRADEKGVLAGTVVDALTGAPLESFAIEIRTTQSGTTEHGASGAFRVDKVQEGPVVVKVRAEGYATQTIEDEVHGGETTQLAAALLRAGAVEGRVTLDGEPAQGILSAYPGDTSAERDHYGWFQERFRMDGLPAGVPHLLVAEIDLARGSNGKLVVRTTVTPAYPASEYELELQRPSATLTGSVTIDGAFTGWLVYALDAGAIELDEPRRSPLLRATAQGKRSPEDFELALPPGDLTLLFRVLRKDGEGGPPRREDQVLTVSVAAGEPTQVSLEAP